MPPAVAAEGVVKRFGSTVALRGVDLHVARGTVLGLLGPNGAGKTTMVRVLATLLAPDEGRASVFGHDVVGAAHRVRELIALTGQFAAIDEILSGRENLQMFGRLFRLSRRDADRRADELLERFDLADAADRPARTYSGGMRRRLDLAGALVADPEVLFLDEPTTGLDPKGRLDMWEVISDLVAGGTTVLLTTQYMEEADRLADDIVVIDRGQVIAQGTADQLKAQVGGERLELTISDRAQLQSAASVLSALTAGSVTTDPQSRSLIAPVTGGAGQLIEALRALDERGIELDDVGLHRPSLDDVFLTLTGHVAEEKTEEVNA